jgi:exodeoxyribonuclease V beta subunit
VADAHATHPDLKDTAWRRLTPEGIADAFSKDFSAVVPDCFDAIAPLKAALARSSRCRSRCTAMPWE